jgi:WhiB family redox-sensing transcriptional regulator
MTVTAYLEGRIDRRSARRSTAGWVRLAACAEHDSAEFFPVGKGPDALAATAHAKAVCARCPVRNLCAEFALCTNQEYGIWGGLDEDERRAIRRSRRRRSER